jgi:hypothetical protein
MAVTYLIHRRRALTQNSLVSINRASSSAKDAMDATTVTMDPTNSNAQVGSNSSPTAVAIETTHQTDHLESSCFNYIINLESELICLAAVNWGPDTHWNFELAHLYRIPPCNANLWLQVSRGQPKWSTMYDIYRNENIGVQLFSLENR